MIAADHLYFRWAPTPEGRIMLMHWCATGLADRFQLPTTWSVTAEGGITPSVHCTKCDRHTFLHDCDRWDWEEIMAMPLHSRPQ